MIQANELRIGNLVSVENKPYIITSGDIYNLDCYYKQYINFYEPIPLTEEWLLRFGAILHPNKNWDLQLKIGAINLSFRVYKKWYSELEGIYLGQHIQFVHQLQNLYHALTGEELKQKTDDTSE